MEHIENVFEAKEQPCKGDHVRQLSTSGVPQKSICRKAVDRIIEDIEKFEDLDQKKREQVVRDVIKYKEPLKARTDKQIATLLALQNMLNLVSQDNKKGNEKRKLVISLNK